MLSRTGDAMPMIAPRRSCNSSPIPAGCGRSTMPSSSPNGARWRSGSRRSPQPGKTSSYTSASAIRALEFHAKNSTSSSVLLSKPTSRRRAGTGGRVGPRIAAQLVGMMGGEIWLESEVALGSTVLLPPA
jgi:hypothetical protein